VLPASHDHREAFGEARNGRVPLGWGEKEGQQDQRRPGALDAVGNAGMGSHFRSGGARHIGMAWPEERDHPCRDLIGLVGDGIAPAPRRRVPGEHGTLGRGQPCCGARCRFSRRPALA
jgi:hypothetical protein